MSLTLNPNKIQLLKGQIAHIADFATLQNESSAITTTSFIPSQIYDELPTLLKTSSKLFEDRRERDVFLTSALGILSGVFNNVCGAYDHQVVHPNLYTYIVAPPASGKGTMAFAKTLGLDYHMHVQSLSSKERDTPKKDTFKPVLYIPANSSSAAVTKLLAISDGRGIICETEADTLNNTLKQDWGGYSDLLRKAFHHESVSYCRTSNNDYGEINRPRLSIVLSGTPSQIPGLIQSVEDGLLSRILFYTFNGAPQWHDVRPRATVTPQEVIEEYSKQVLRDAVRLDKAATIEFTLTNDQWDILNEHFNRELQRLTAEGNYELQSIVKRSGLMTFKIAMLLSVVRMLQGDIQERLECIDIDFNSAIRLSRIYLEHGLTIFQSIPKKSNMIAGEETLYNTLPSEFNRSIAVELGQGLGIGERTIDKHLSTLKMKNLVTKTSKGIYKKL